MYLFVSLHHFLTYVNNVCLLSVAVILIKGFDIHINLHTNCSCTVYEGEKISSVKDYETTKIWKKKNVKIEL